MGAARKPVLPVMAVFCVLVGWLVWSAVPALAVAPETPGPVSVGSPGAVKVIVRGVLSPHGEGQPGTYEFLYRASSTDCEGGEHAPVSPGLASGVQGEEVAQELTGLTPETEYTVCLSERNLNQSKGEEAVGTAVTFKTEGVLEAPKVTTPASEITDSSIKLQGVLNPGAPGAPGSYEFLYRRSPSECQRENPETHLPANEFATPTEVALGGEGEMVPAFPIEVSGLAPNTAYTFCLLARNEAGETVLGSPVTFKTISHKPNVNGESFSKVGSTGATISAQVDTGGLETTFTVQYGVTDAYGSESSVKLPASSSAASTQLTGLEPNTEYHFRILVTNGDGSVIGAGAGASFTTLPVGTGGGLPDKREYEMVTPPENEDAEVYVPSAYQLEGGEAEGLVTVRIFKVAANGDGVVYEGDPTHNGRQESSGNSLGSSYLATRAAGGGWRQVSIQPPGRAAEYQGFSNDLSGGVLDTDSEAPSQDEGQLPGPQGPTGNYEDIYRHIFGEESYQPLITAIPPNRSADVFGQSIFRQRQGKKYSGLTYAGGSSDMGQLLFGANDALIKGGGGLERELNEDVKQEIAQGENFEYLYDSSEGRLSLVNVLPDGKVAPNAIFGGPPGSGREVRYNPPDFSHAISSDGSRVFWSTLEVTGESESGKAETLTLSPTALYVRENATQPQSPLNAQNECTVSNDACTVQVDRGVGGGGRFWTASSDGSKVFFTKLDLYEYDVNTGATIDLTPGVNVQGVIGASENGDYVYYVASSYNLYMLHKGGGGWEAPVLIATLSQRDGEYNYGLYGYGPGEGQIGDWAPDMGQRTAEVTPDGGSVVFMSDQSLKAVGFPSGYPNKRADEVYVYSAAQRVLSCASCSPSGESGGGGFLPISWSNTNIPSWISEDGDQVFFDSGAALVSQDTDDTQDVYEWEREGSGSCAKGVARTDGCIYLLSGGTSDVGSWLIGSSAIGSDVFMISRAHLTPEDQGETFNVFDARVEGVPPVSPPTCVGTGCQGVPAPPPTFATPSSSTFEGVGNFQPLSSVRSLVKVKKKSLSRAQKLSRGLKACREKPKKRRASCEVRARRRYGVAKKAKKASKSARGSE